MFTHSVDRHACVVLDCAYATKTRPRSEIRHSIHVKKVPREATPKKAEIKKERQEETGLRKSTIESNDIEKAKPDQRLPNASDPNNKVELKRIDRKFYWNNNPSYFKVPGPDDDWECAKDGTCRQDDKCGAVPPHLVQGAWDVHLGRWGVHVSMGAAITKWDMYSPSGNSLDELSQHNGKLKLTCESRSCHWCDGDGGSYGRGCFAMITSEEYCSPGTREFPVNLRYDPFKWPQVDRNFFVGLNSPFHFEPKLSAGIDSLGGNLFHGSIIENRNPDFYTGKSQESLGLLSKKWRRSRTYSDILYALNPIVEVVARIKSEYTDPTSGKIDMHKLKSKVQGEEKEKDRPIVGHTFLLSTLNNNVGVSRAFAGLSVDFFAANSTMFTNASSTWGISAEMRGKPRASVVVRSQCRFVLNFGAKAKMQPADSDADAFDLESELGQSFYGLANSMMLQFREAVFISFYLLIIIFI